MRHTPHMPRASRLPRVPRTHRTRYARRGVSLVEVTISIAIVGGLLASVFTAVGVSAKRGFSSAQRTKAAWLARDLLAEAAIHPCEADAGNLLSLTPIDLSDVEELTKAAGGTDRSAFDSVYDYANWTSSPPIDMDGKPIPGYSGWTRAVTVLAINPQTLARRTTDDSAALITVIALGPNGERATASVVRTNAADTLRGLSDTTGDGLIDIVLDAPSTATAAATAGDEPGGDEGQATTTESESGNGNGNGKEKKK